MKFLKWYSAIVMALVSLVNLAYAATDDVMFFALIFNAPITVWVWLVALEKDK